MSTTSHASIERRAKSVTLPDLSDESLAQAGANDFEAMCTGCHGAPGKKPAAMGLGLNPAPPNLAEEAAHSTPAELFWTTKHGIRMTGMPAFGATHEDAEIWPVVVFMMKLPSLDAKSYKEFLANAEGKGHHGPENGQDDHDEGDSHSHGENIASEESDHSDDGHDHEH